MAPSYHGQAGDVAALEGLHPVDLAADVKNDLPVAEGGTGASNTAAARSNLGVDPAGTDNSTDVSLAGSPNYLTIAGQVITRALVSLTSHITGILPVGNGGSGVASLTDHGVLLGSGAAAITVLGVAADGQLLVGVAGADPVWATNITIPGTLSLSSYLDFLAKATPANPAAGDARMYIDTVDANNDALYVKIKKAGAFVEVEVTSPHAIEGGTHHASRDPEIDIDEGKIRMRLYDGRVFEAPLAWQEVAAK